MSRSNRVAIITNNLICEMNAKYYSKLELYFKTNQWTIGINFANVDLVVFSTCGYSDEMHQAIRNALQELQRIHFPEPNIIIMGCQPKTHETELANLFKGRIINFGEEHLLDRMIGAAIPFQNIKSVNVFRPFGDKKPLDLNELYNIQIADGCLKQCTYCVINKAHGDIRSTPLAEIEQQFTTAVQKGYRNINLIAIDTLSYGYDTGTNIIELLEHLLTIEPEVKFYLGSLHIRWLENYWEGLLSLCQRGKINSLHIGLQHVNDQLLKRMGRPVKFKDLYEALLRFRRECPDLYISTDIIVGFPGETEAIFTELVEVFEHDPCFDLVNFFAYSDVKAAPAYQFDGKVDPFVKISRWEKFNQILGPRSPAIALQQQNSAKFKRYRAAHQCLNEKGYYFCYNSFFE